MQRHFIYLSLLVGQLAACTSMAPTYHRPDNAIPAQLPQGAAYPVTTAETTQLVPWDSFVLDSRLKSLIQIALDNNQDLKKTIASIESARAQYRIQRASFLPTIDADVSTSKARNYASATNQTSISKSATAEVGLSSYEIDLFGKVRSLSDAALETYLSTEEASQSTRISLIAEVVEAWLTLASDQSQLALAHETKVSAEQSLKVTNGRHQLGVASMVDVHDAETTYHQADVNIASYTALVAQDKNALDVLLGTTNYAADLLPTSLPDMDNTLSEVPAGLSSAILLDRPDVLEAEHQLKSANANIGAARAAFFPSISLTATAGVASAALSSLFTGGASSIWAVTPAVSLPLFAGGSNVATLNYDYAQREYYVANYASTLQTAFQEAANALSVKGTIHQEINSQSLLVKAAQNSYFLSNQRYINGIDSYLTALTAQRTLYSAQQSLISLQLTALENRITLYRVLGGGRTITSQQ